MTFADMGGTTTGVAEDEVNWVIHAALTVSDTIVLMGADHPSHIPGEPTTQQVSISGDDDATLRSWWDGVRGRDRAPAAGAGTLGRQLGMLSDRYGVDWLVNIAGEGRG